MLILVPVLLLAGCAFERSVSKSKVVRYNQWGTGGRLSGIDIDQEGTCKSDYEVAKTARKMMDAWCGEDNFEITSQHPSSFSCNNGYFKFSIKGNCR